MKDVPTPVMLTLFFSSLTGLNSKYHGCNMKMKAVKT